MTYTLQQNGITERIDTTLHNKIRCMLSSSGLPKLFWGETLKIAAYLVSSSIGFSKF